MKTIQISDELYERLKSCVVDPFDDTPESVVSRLMYIADKAKARWSSWDARAQTAQQEAASEGGRPRKSEHWNEQCEAVL